MDTVFFERHFPGRAVARLVLGRPLARVAAAGPGPREAVVRLGAGQCFGVLWWVRGPAGLDLRVLAVGRAVDRTDRSILLPGFSRATDVRVLTSQAGPLGAEGRLATYLDAAQAASLLGRPLPPLSFAAYRRLVPAYTISGATFDRLVELFDPPVNAVPRRLHEAVRRLAELGKRTRTYKRRRGTRDRMPDWHEPRSPRRHSPTDASRDVSV